MSRLDELPPDQSAALSLLLRQRKSYRELAGMLGLSERAVHDRAHAALAVLAPSLARALPAEQRAEIGDYLLGQQPGVAERLRTRAFIGASEPARAWAQALSDELEPLADGPLPDIPAAPPPTPPSTPEAVTEPSRSGAGSPGEAPAGGPQARAAAASSAPSSRLGGALLLAALVAAVVVAVILITSSGGSSKHTAKRTSTSAASKTGPKIGPQLALRPPSPASKSAGVVVVLSEKGKRAFYIEAQNLPATQGFYYAVWLYNSPTNAEALSRGPQVGSTHKLAGGSALPANAGRFREILLTRETDSKPTRPGKIVLRGPFRISG